MKFFYSSNSINKKILGCTLCGVPANSCVQGEGEPKFSPSSIPSSGGGESTNRRAYLASFTVPRNRLCKFGSRKAITCKFDLYCSECRTTCCSNCSSERDSFWSDLVKERVCYSCSEYKTNAKDFRLRCEVDHLENQVEIQSKILMEVLTRLDRLLPQDAAEE